MHTVHLVFRTLQNTTTLMANYHQVQQNHTRPTAVIRASYHKQMLTDQHH